MAGKRLNKDTNEVLEEIKSYLNENNQMNDEYSRIIKKSLVL